MLVTAYASPLNFRESFFHDFLLQVQCKGRALLLTVQKRKIYVIFLSLVFPSLVFGILLGTSELIELIHTCYDKTSYLHDQAIHPNLIKVYPCMCADAILMSNCLKDRTLIYWTTAKHSHSNPECQHLNDFYSNLNSPEQSSAFCKDSMRSLVAFYNNGALPCDCHSAGATSPTCSPLGGQCACRPNVIGRQCSQCRTGYYGFPFCKCKYVLALPQLLAWPPAESSEFAAGVLQPEFSL